MTSPAVASTTRVHPSDTQTCTTSNEVGSWGALQTAVQNVSSGSTATICLSATFTADSSDSVNAGNNLVLNSGANVTLDLNGYDLTITDPAPSDAAINVPSGATLTIQDSSAGASDTLTATGNGGGAGIGGNGSDGADGGASGTITIDGGTINATGGDGGSYDGGGAGIGGGGGGDNWSGGSADGGASGTIEITSNSAVTATGGDGGFEGGCGAGIGGGGGGSSFSSSAYGGASGTIEITSNSAVTATGGDGGFEGGCGAGIGGGGGGSSSSSNADGGASTTITITSSSVTANGGSSGGGGPVAGVGGGGGGYQGSNIDSGAAGSLEVLASSTGSSGLSGLVAAALKVDVGATLTVPAGQTLTLTSSTVTSNAGTIAVAGTLNGSNTITNSRVILQASGSSIPGDGSGVGGVLITGYAYALSSDLNVSSLPAALQGSVSWTDGTPDTDPDMVYVFAPTLADAGVSLPAVTIPSPATYGFYTATSAGTLVDADTDLSQAIGTASSTGTIAQNLYANYTNLPQTLSFGGLGSAGTVGGSNTFTASSTGGSGQPIDVSVDPASQPSNACTLTQTSSGWSVSYQHAGSCVIDANEAASTDGLWAAASELSQTVAVAPASTSINVAVNTDSITATVTSTGGTPAGSVRFFLNGVLIGTAPLINGVATLTYTIPTDQTQHIAAAFISNDDFTASSNTTTTTSSTGTGSGTGTTTGTGSTAPSRPSITATITSKTPKNKAGWYRTPVTITFTCITHGSPLANPCPGPVTLSHSGAGQSISRTITTQNGGIATVTVSPINIELPNATRVQAVGVLKNHYYTTTPRLGCRASALSGTKTCKIHTHTSTQPGSILSVVHYTITTTTTAGNQRVTHGSYQQLNTYLIGANYRNGTFHIRTGRAYTLTVTNSHTQPHYLYPAPTPNTPTGGNIPLHPNGPNHWTLTIQIYPGLTTHTHNWTLGIQVGNQLRKLQITNN